MAVCGGYCTIAAPRMYSRCVTGVEEALPTRWEDTTISEKKKFRRHGSILNFFLSIYSSEGLLLEEAAEETLEASTVACFVLGHLVYAVVDSVETEFLGHLGNVHLAGASTFLSQHALLNVGLGVPYHLAEHLSKT